MNLDFVTIALLIEVLAYLIYTGVIPSISDSYRTVKDKRIYHAFFAIFSITIMMQELYAPDFLDNWWLAGGACVWGLSLAAEFWKKDQGFWHVAFTYTGIVICQTLSVIWAWQSWGLFAIIAPAVLILGGWSMGSFIRWNVTYWREVLAVLTICIPIIKTAW